MHKLVDMNVPIFPPVQTPSSSTPSSSKEYLAKRVAALKAKQSQNPPSTTPNHEPAPDSSHNSTEVRPSSKEFIAQRVAALKAKQSQNPPSTPPNDGPPAPTEPPPTEPVPPTEPAPVEPAPAPQQTPTSRPRMTISPRIAALIETVIQNEARQVPPASPEAANAPAATEVADASTTTQIADTSAARPTKTAAQPTNAIQRLEVAIKTLLTRVHDASTSDKVVASSTKTEAPTTEKQTQKVLLANVELIETQNTIIQTIKDIIVLAQKDIPQPTESSSKLAKTPTPPLTAELKSDITELLQTVISTAAAELDSPHSFKAIATQLIKIVPKFPADQQAMIQTAIRDGLTVATTIPTPTTERPSQPQVSASTHTAKPSPVTESGKQPSPQPAQPTPANPTRELRVGFKRLLTTVKTNPQLTTLIKPFKKIIQASPKYVASITTRVIEQAAKHQPTQLPQLVKTLSTILVQNSPAKDTQPLRDVITDIADSTKLPTETKSMVLTESATTIFKTQVKQHDDSHALTFIREASSQLQRTSSPRTADDRVRAIQSLQQALDHGSTTEAPAPQVSSEHSATTQHKPATQPPNHTTSTIVTPDTNPSVPVQTVSNKTPSQKQVFMKKMHTTLISNTTTNPQHTPSQSTPVVPTTQTIMSSFSKQAATVKQLNKALNATSTKPSDGQAYTQNDIPAIIQEKSSSTATPTRTSPPSLNSTPKPTPAPHHTASAQVAKINTPVIKTTQQTSSSDNRQSSIPTERQAKPTLAPQELVGNKPIPLNRPINATIIDTARQLMPFQVAQLKLPARQAVAIIGPHIDKIAGLSKVGPAAAIAPHVDFISKLPVDQRAAFIDGISSLPKEQLRPIIDNISQLPKPQIASFIDTVSRLPLAKFVQLISPMMNLAPEQANAFIDALKHVQHSKFQPIIDMARFINHPEKLTQMISLIQKLGPQATAQSLIQGLPPHIKDQLKTLDPNAIQAFIDTINEESDWDTGIKKARKDRRQKADFDEANKHRAYTIQLVEMFHGKGHHLWAIVAEYRQRLRERNLLNDQAYLASQSK